MNHNKGRFSCCQDLDNRMMAGARTSSMGSIGDDLPAGLPGQYSPRDEIRSPLALPVVPALQLESLDIDGEDTVPSELPPSPYPEFVLTAVSPTSIHCIPRIPTNYRSVSEPSTPRPSSPQESALQCSCHSMQLTAMGSSAAKSPYKGNLSPFVQSPRISARGWRPVMPGYGGDSDAGHRQQRVVIQHTVQMGHRQEEMSSLRDIIPAMPYPLAIVCLICNVICPGLGTFISGVSVFCCSKRRHGRMKSSVIWLNTWVALFQFLLTPVMFLGWVWSVKWGLLFLSISEAEFNKVDESAEIGAERRTSIPSTHQHRYSISDPQRLTTSTTTTTTTVSLPDAHESGDSVQPIIVLQEAPVFIQQDNLPDLRASLPRRPRGLNPNNPRHQRILRQQNTVYEEDVPPVLLNPDTLEDIVIRNGIPLNQTPFKT